MKNKKRWLLLLMISFVFTGCLKPLDFNANRKITVVSREDGSGTRSAFTELFDIIEKDENSKKDLTTKEAIITNKNGIMLMTIENDTHSIGYSSLGALNDNVKMLAVDNITPNSANIIDGSYPISRPFNIATKKDVSELVADFINYILSDRGQSIVEKMYVRVNTNAKHYTSSNLSGKIVVAGSSSVTPIMEKLKEDYELLNPNVNIEIQMSDSTSGMMATINNTCDIGMASRDLTANELEQVVATKIAVDGIVLIVNQNNPINNISKQTARDIFIGKIKFWKELQ